jgi:hypothetical protein
MKLEAEAFMTGRRDSGREKAVHKWLRSLPDSQRYDFVSCCLGFPARDNRVFDMAVACISRPEDALTIVRMQFAQPDASGIKWWLTFGISKLGATRVLTEVASYLDSAPDTVSMAIYWLPSLVPTREKKAVQTLAELREKAASRGIIKGSKMKVSEDGKILFRDIYGQKD